MPLAANTSTVQLLNDNSKRTVVKFQFFQHAPNAASHLASTLMVNVDTLVGRTMTLTGPAVTNGLFITGEQLTAGDGAVAYMMDYNLSGANGVMRVILANSQVQLSNSDVLTGTLSNRAFTVSDQGAVSDPALLTLRSLIWSVSGNTQTRIALEWASAGGTANTEIYSVGVGSGYIGKNVFACVIPNNCANTSGGVNITTYATPAYSGYSLIAEFEKVQGFAERPIY